MPSKYLKKANIPTLIVFLIWNIAIFLVASNGMSSFWDGVKERISELGTQNSLFSFLTPLVLVIACGLLPASWKATLVFWRFRNALPGCRAFSKFAKCDPRIDDSLLIKKLDKVPISARDENAVWYRWYKVVQDKIIVKESHKQFLLNRDLAGIAFLFCVFGTPALIPSGASFLNICFYAAITLLQYIIFSIVARNHGNRFVCNVLAEYQNKE
ncbi:hypothetical protein ACFL2O_07205 [Thermodesulfobacteriota bacterium]